MHPIRPSFRLRFMLPALSALSAAGIFCAGVCRGADAPGPVAEVFILAGQSNMEGQAVVDLDHPEHYNGGRGTLVDVMMRPETAWRYAHLRDGAGGDWRVRDDVMVRFRTADGVKAGGLGIGYAGYAGRHHFGPELQFGQVAGDAIEAPVLLIKTAWGGKSLFADFRPPEPGTEGGPYYRQMLDEVREALAAAPSEFPALAGHRLRLAGFVWMQGWNDMVDERARAEYAENLANLIRAVRRDLSAPDLPFVIGELGNLGADADEPILEIRRAQREAAGLPEFAGTVAFAPTAGFARSAEASPNVGHGHHWFGNAESYFLVGDALGRSMLELLGIGHRVIRDVGYGDGGSDYERERCRLDVYLPTGRAAAAPMPVVVWFHGGGLTGGDKEAFEAQLAGRFFAANGCVAVVPNYRLSPAVSFPAYVEDAAAAVGWAARHARAMGIERDGLFIGGHSAGAYLALMVGLDRRYLEAEGVSPGDLAGLIPVSGQTDSHWAVRDERGIPRTTSVVDESAPLFHARADAPPILLAVADDDLEGRAALNERLLAAMREAGHEHTELHVVDERDHGSLIWRLPDPADPLGPLIQRFIAANARQ